MLLLQQAYKYNILKNINYLYIVINNIIFRMIKEEFDDSFDYIMINVT